MARCEAMTERLRSCSRDARYVCTPEGGTPIYLCEEHRGIVDRDCDCKELGDD